MEPQLLSIATSRAMDWFKIHAEQRMKLFNFYLIILLAMLAGFSAAHEKDLIVVEMMISILVILLSTVFNSLDKRTSQLIKDSEKALMEIDRIIRYHTNISTIELADLASDKRGNESYRESFRTVFIGGLLFGITGFVIALTTQIMKH